MEITRMDHLVLTVSDLERTCTFYSRVLGMEIRTTPENRTSLHFGSCKINLHRQGAEYAPHARNPTPGSADLCFLTETPIEHVIEELKRHQVTIMEGPVQRSGSTGPICSVYFRDPDGNLLEIANTSTPPDNQKKMTEKDAA